MARSIVSSSGAGAAARASGHRRLTPGSGAALAERATWLERSARGIRRLVCDSLVFAQLRLGAGCLGLLARRRAHRLAGRHGHLLLGGELAALRDDAVS